eukprot:TRINITY_DN9187_c0_g1_i2.p1 TRINITY_DN9187_c0_g1~~TRINITY_DN9187_c0_g1_i2.p1  ORF type:complete len:328 (-),score=80.08 TRINITY_DN9187_c0_g1_i2:217-1200(-)
MREEISTNANLPIQKKVLHAGHGEMPQFPDGTKVKYHYVAKLMNEEGTLLDDSRSWKKPMELIFGKKFKMESWEMSLRTMRIGEVASFRTKKIYTHSYPLVAKTFRETFGEHKGKHSHKSTHVCGMAMAAGGLGHDDLNELMKSPQDLEFIFELLGVETDYEKESWQMDADEKLDSVPQLKLEGNKLFKEDNFVGAEEKYRAALSRLEQLMLREKPGESEWTELLELKVPLLMNLAQCRLKANDYYEAITHTTEVIQHKPDNVKAYFRRGKANAGAWNPEAARDDFNKAMQLDKSLTSTCRKEIALIDEEEKRKDSQDKQKLDKLFS